MLLLRILFRPLAEASALHGQQLASDINYTSLLAIGYWSTRLASSAVVNVMQFHSAGQQRIPQDMEG